MDYELPKKIFLIRNFKAIRLFETAYSYFEFYYAQLLKRINLGGARKISVDEFQNTTRSLLKKTKLGRKHDQIVVSADSVLLYNLELFGIYEKFLINLFCSEIIAGPRDATFVDIGANCGLISVGVARSNFKISRLIAVEPVAENRVALASNLKKMHINFLIVDYGLSNDLKSNEIFIPADQFGSATLVPGTGEGKRQIINLRSPSQFYQEVLSGIENLFVKCDIEGKDIEVLMNFPVELWNKVVAVSFEISRRQLEKISDVKVLIDTLKYAGLDIIRLESRFPRVISFEEIENLHLDFTRNNWNIFISRG